MTESGSWTQKLGIDKIQDAWPHAYMQPGIFWEHSCEGGVPVFKGMEESKAKPL